MRIAVSRQSFLLLSLALLAGLGAAWFAQRYIQQHIARLDAGARVPMLARVVAAHDLPAGIRLEAHHVAVREFPAQVVSSDSIAPEQYADLLQGRSLASSLRAGDAILAIHAHMPLEAPFSSRLEKGRRALTMPIDEVNSASGLLAPGDLIDLYVSFDHQGKRMTAPLLQGVLVLATGQSTATQGMAAAGYGTVTLDTAPEDAVKLVAARQGGTITALLRQRDDDQATQRAARGDLAALLGVGRPQPEDRSRRIAVIYGDRPTRQASLSSSGETVLPDTALFDLPEAQALVSAWLQDRELEGGERPAPHRLGAGHDAP